MSFAYVEGTVWLDDVTGPIDPGMGYLMCGDHADRLSPPVGWTLVDRRRGVRPLFVSREVA